MLTEKKCSTWLEYNAGRLDFTVNSFFKDEN
jgi:hypothetical protein